MSPRVRLYRNVGNFNLSSLALYLRCFNFITNLVAALLSIRSYRSVLQGDAYNKVNISFPFCIIMYIIVVPKTAAIRRRRHSMKPKSKSSRCTCIDIAADCASLRPLCRRRILAEFLTCSPLAPFWSYVVLTLTNNVETTYFTARCQP